MTDEVITKADQDIEYLYDRAHKAGIYVSGTDEDVFVELVGRHYSDGHDCNESRRRAFINFTEMKKK